MTFTLFLVALFTPFLWLMAREPIVRRLALRNPSRRRGESALVILGAMFGTAMITGALVVGDTLDFSIRRAAHEQLGPIDEIVSTYRPDQWTQMQARLSGLEDDPGGAVDGVLSMVTLQASATSGEGSSVQVSPRTQLLEVDFEAARAFGDDPDATGMEGSTPEAGRAVISRDAADLLKVGSDDVISVFVYGKAITLIVDRILDQRGVAGFWRNQGTRAANVFVAPGTVDPLALAAFSSTAEPRFVPPARILAISNSGGVEEGARFTDQVRKELDRRLGDLGVQVLPVKRDVLDTAADSSKRYGDLFAAMGAFGALAGVLLVVNLFVMLAEERKPEMGMLRALGMRRAVLVRVFTAEGWLYAVSGAVLGSLVGLGLGRVIVILVARAILSVGGELGLRLRFFADFSSLWQGFAVGTVISMITVVGTSVRISRINVIRAIRNLPAPPARQSSWRSLLLGWVGLGVGLGFTVWGFASDGQFGILLGPLIALAALVPLLGRPEPGRGLITVVSLLALAWGTFSLRLVADEVVETSDITLFVAQGIALTGAAVALVTAQQERIANVLRRLGGGDRALSVHLGLAYPLYRLMRTGLTVAMYSLVVFTLTFVTILSSILDGRLVHLQHRMAGGFDVAMRSSSANPISFDEVAAKPEVSGLASFATVPSTFTVQGDKPAQWLLSAFDEKFLELGPPTLRDRGDYPNDLAVYRAVLTNPGLIIVDPLFLQLGSERPIGSIGVGTVMDITDPLSGTGRRVKVAAMGELDLAFNGALYGRAGARALFGAGLVPNRAYVALDGVDPQTFSEHLMRTYRANGAEVEPFSAIVANMAVTESQFFELARGYLGLGLIAGVAGLAVVMVRAVRERRRQIGVLRALGFMPARVGASFLIEAAFVAFEGIVIGVVLATITAYNVVTSTEILGTRLAFSVSEREILQLVLATLAVSLIATMIPAYRAARIKPAVALRIAD
ncbi:MAG: ABC transporter permease [Acidimicrobiales bacterium]